MGEQGQEENRQENRHQDLQDNFLYAFGAHGQMPHEAAFCVKKIIAVKAQFRVPLAPHGILYSNAVPLH